MKYPTIAGYKFTEKIRGGGSASVFRAMHVKNQQVVACKLIYLTDDTTEEARKAVDKEMKIHAALKHRNVLEFISAAIVDPNRNHSYVPGIYILLEFAEGGDLFDRIAAHVGIGEDDAHSYFKQLAEGMRFVHAQGMCHRDLKPENLLLDAAGTLKISDFGLSVVYKHKETGETRLLTELCGTLPYTAPELYSRRPYRAEPIDIWSMGITLFALLGGNTPWDEPTGRCPEFRRYLSGRMLDEEPWSKFSTNALHLLCRILTVEPEKRISMPEIYSHPWFTSVCDGVVATPGD